MFRLGLFLLIFSRLLRSACHFTKNILGLHGYLLPKLDLIAIQDFVIGNSANSLLISKFTLLFDMFYETLHGLVVII